MRNRSRDYGNSRGYIRVDDGRSGSRSKYIIHFYSSNMVETVGGDGRCGYRSQTIHSYYHNPCDYGRLLIIPENEIGDSMDDGARLVSRSQYIRYYSFHNYG